MVRPSLIFFGSFLSVALSAASARGQQKPPGTQPGQVERRFKRPREPSAKPGAVAIPEAGQPPPSNAESVKVVLNQLTIDGVTAYRPETLRAAYANLLTKEVTLGEIYRVAE